MLSGFLNTRQSAWMIVWVAIVVILQFSGMNVIVFQYMNELATFIPGIYWALLTNLGDTAYIICLFLPLIIRYPKLAIPFWLTLIFGGLFIQLLKHWIAAPRPPAVLGFDSINVYGPVLMSKSFPSGHSFAIWSSLALIRTILKNNRYIYLLMIVAGLVAFSRIAVGVHWPVDVISGSVLGWYLGRLITSLKIEEKYSENRYLWLISIAILTASVLSMYGYDNGYEKTIYLHYVAATLSLLLSLSYIVNKYKIRKI